MGTSRASQPIPMFAVRAGILSAEARDDVSPDLSGGIAPTLFQGMSSLSPAPMDRSLPLRRSHEPTHWSRQGRRSERSASKEHPRGRRVA
jgi:hypothetical protein